MKSIIKALNGCFSILFYFINTVFWVCPIVLLSFCKLMPIAGWQKLMSILLDGCASAWITINTYNQAMFSRTHIEVSGDAHLSNKEWYLVISNHQSWVDILALQRIFNGKIPFLKFFLKKELIWVPFLGIAWWALDFPFMRRYSKSFLAKNPHLKGKDLETTQKACEKFQYKPVSIMNFVEGTRITPDKLVKSQHRFTHLLPPKAGGIAFVLGAMGQRLTKLVDVTIYYPKGIPTYWQFVSGQVHDIRIHIETTDIADLFEQGIFSDAVFSQAEQRAEFQRWLNTQWHRKDELISKFTQDQTSVQQ